MIAIKPSDYESIKHFFADIPGSLWHLESLKSRNIGTVFIDILPNTKSVCIESPFSFYYFAGAYNASFMMDCISHMVRTLIPVGEQRPMFIFSPDDAWKMGLENYLKPYANQHFGAYLTRRLHHLNHKRYEDVRKSLLIS